MKNQILLLAAISTLGASAQPSLHASQSAGAGAGKIGSRSGKAQIIRTTDGLSTIFK
jgi:hypothetical protein